MRFIKSIGVWLRSIRRKFVSSWKGNNIVDAPRRWAYPEGPWQGGAEHVSTPARSEGGL